MGISGLKWWNQLKLYKKPNLIWLGVLIFWTSINFLNNFQINKRNLKFKLIFSINIFKFLISKLFMNLIPFKEGSKILIKKWVRI